MIDHDNADMPNAQPSRRTFICSIGLLLTAVFPAWITRARSTQNIIVVGGWILADTDLR